MASLLSIAGFNGVNGTHFELQLYYDLAQSVEGNYTDVTYYLKMKSKDGYSGSGAACNGYINGEWVGNFTSIGVNTTIDIGQRTVREYHNSTGAKTATFSATINTPWNLGSANTSGNFQLPNIARFATITNSIGDFNDESTPWFEYSNPAGASMNCWLEVNPNGQHLCIRNIGSDSSGTYTWDLTETERNQLRAKLANTNGGTGIIRVGLYSTIGETTSASFVDRNFTIINANPSFDNYNFEDTNTTTKNLTGSTINNVINVNGYSNIQATIPVADKAVAEKQATMVKYRFSISDSSIDINYSDSSEVNGTINGAKDGIYTLYAIDSRNNSTPVIKQATNIINYEKIIIDKTNSSLVRDNNQVGTNAILTLTGTFWNNNFGQVVNTIKTVEYKLKKSDSSTWITGTTTIVPTTSSNSFTFTGQIASDNQDTSWDLDASYNVQLTVGDELSSATIDFILNSAVPTLCLDKNGVGIMCAYDPSLGGKLQVDGKVIEGGTILWENNDPSNDFASQTVTLNSSDYNSYEIIFATGTTGDDALRTIASGLMPKGYGTRLAFSFAGSGGANVRSRIVNYVSDTSLTFADGLGATGSTASTVRNDTVIPLYIIGYNTGLFN